VLADKQPIIAAEMKDASAPVWFCSEGAARVVPAWDLKIVPVQIKEGVVSSTQLWQNLQMPFRATASASRAGRNWEQQQIDTGKQINANNARRPRSTNRHGTVAS